MAPRWHFKKLPRGYMDRQNSLGEFFASEAIFSPAEALAREAIQNSLDARVDRSRPVRVSFTIGAVPHAVAYRYFESAWPHFLADESGVDAPSRSEQCEFVVVEDFNTTGLVGRTHAWPPESNPFTNFFLAECKTQKGRESLGRWGIGKYVFPRSSQVKSFLAVTTRCDDGRSLFMGQAILHSRLMDGELYNPDGHYGIDHDGLTVPVENDAEISRFSHDFQLRRKAGEHGLSVLIPWRDPSLTQQNILLSTIANFSHPILEQRLEVVVYEGGASVLLSAETLLSVARELAGAEGDEPMPNRRDLFSEASLLQQAMLTPSSEIIRLEPAPAKKPVWESRAITEEVGRSVRRRLQSGQLVALEAPLTIRRKHPDAQRDSTLRLFLRSEPGASGRPLFIRSGIRVSDVAAPVTHGIRAVVIADTGTDLATALGDAEDPGHTRWQKEGEHFKGRYFFPGLLLRFVTHSVQSILKLLNEGDAEPDSQVLQDFFSVPRPDSPGNENVGPRAAKPRTGERPTPMPVLPRKPSSYVVSRKRGGFEVVSAPSGTKPPRTLTVRMAYDRRRGSPWKKYAAADFEVNKAPIVLDVSGAEVTVRKFNMIRLLITQPIFRASLSGFDEHRDLIVRVEPKENDDD